MLPLHLQTHFLPIPGQGSIVQPAQRHGIILYPGLTLPTPRVLNHSGSTKYCTLLFVDAMVALCHCSEPAAAEASSSNEEDESLDAATQRLAHASRNLGGSTAPIQSKKLKPAAVMRKKQKHEGSSLLAGWVILECPWVHILFPVHCCVA